MEILAKYIPVAKDKPDEPSKQEKQQDAPKEQPEYFDAELLSLIFIKSVWGNSLKILQRRTFMPT